MGNHSAKLSHKQQHQQQESAADAAPQGFSPSRRASYPIWKKRFDLISDGADELTRAHFDQFGSDFGEKLWAYFADGDTVSAERFMEKAVPLFGTSTDVYVKLVDDAEAFLRMSSDLVDCSPIDNDEVFANVLSTVKSCGDDYQSTVQWKHAEAARIADPLQLRFHAAFSSIPVPSIPRSDIVSPFCMFYLRTSIPASYLPPQNYEWSKLYSSLTSGMSTSRFESTVFGYKSRTLALIRTSAGIFALGVDQEWRHSLAPFGGPDAFLVKLAPGPTVVTYSGASNIFCNLKLRATKMGISWKSAPLDVDKDLSQVHEMEVWACGAATHLEEHSKLKVWQKNQIEKNKKVPLPGNWDDNADKTLLEMAGFQFSNERNNDPRPEERRE